MARTRNRGTAPDIDQVTTSPANAMQPDVPGAVADGGQGSPRTYRRSRVDSQHNGVDGSAMDGLFNADTQARLAEAKEAARLKAEATRLAAKEKTAAALGAVSRAATSAVEGVAEKGKEIASGSGAHRSGRSPMQQANGSTWFWKAVALIAVAGLSVGGSLAGYRYYSEQKDNKETAEKMDKSDDFLRTAPPAIPETSPVPVVDPEQGLDEIFGTVGAANKPDKPAEPPVTKDPVVKIVAPTSLPPMANGEMPLPSDLGLPKPVMPSGPAPSRGVAVWDDTPKPKQAPRAQQRMPAVASYEPAPAPVRTQPKPQVTQPREPVKAAPVVTGSDTELSKSTQEQLKALSEFGKGL